MATTKPYEQLVGPLTVYVASVGTAFPAVNAVPGAGWNLLGATKDEGKFKHGGAVEFLYDNDYQGPRKAVRPEELVTWSFKLVGLTLENYSRVLHNASNVIANAGPPATKKLKLTRGYIPDEYAMLLRGSALSPYGAFPGQYEMYRGVFADEPEPTFQKAAEQAALDCVFTALVDAVQAAGEEMGILIVQTA